MFTKLAYWWLNRKDAQRKLNIQRAAFADDRWILDLTVYGRGDRPVRFTPRRDEIETFLGMFVLPWLHGSRGFFNEFTWDGPKGGPKHSEWRLSLIRFPDVTRIEIRATTEEYREAIKAKLEGMWAESQPKQNQPPMYGVN